MPMLCDILMLKPTFLRSEDPFSQLKFAYESPRRGAATKERAGGDFDAAYGGWDIDGEPYTKKDNTEFDWFRSRMLGGRTNHWGRISLRFGPKDFQPNDGVSERWPITYEEVKLFDRRR